MKSILCIPSKVQPGQRFSRWEVLGVAFWRKTDKRKVPDKYCVVKCDCGHVDIVLISNLLRGHSTGCCCIRNSRRHRIIARRHGMAKSRLYRIWCAMRDRCNLTSNDNFKYYGGRGISVCQEWNDSFVAFKEWALSNGYNDDLVIDRIDPNQNYSQQNCRWISKLESAGNKRCTVLREAWGEKKTARQWCLDERCVVSHKLLLCRIRRGWPVEKALTEPIDEHHLRINASRKRNRMVT